MAKGNLLSDRDLQRLQAALRKIESWTAPPPPRRRTILSGGGGSSRRLAQVDNATACATGYYKCYFLSTVDADDWNSEADLFTTETVGETLITVYNLNERAHVGAVLAAGDYLDVWTITDDEGNSRYIGLPVDNNVGKIRFAKTQAAGSGTIASLSCKLLNSDDTTTNQPNITVYLLPTGASINTANYVPAIANDQTVPVYKSQTGYWIMAMSFHETEEC